MPKFVIERQVSGWPQQVACAVGLLFCTLVATPTWAGVIYEYREEGSSRVIGTLRIASPPASATSGWSVTDSSDSIALYLEDSVFGLGAGNLLSIAATAGVAVLSLDGPNLDVGHIGITFPTVVPGNRLDPTIDRSMSLSFRVPTGSDFIGLSTTFTFPDGSIQIGDLLLLGDWAVPEPGTAALVAIAIAAAASRAAGRKTSPTTTV